jgi:selenocysteine lyase/cysteine desulfurase
MIGRRRPADDLVRSLLEGGFVTTARDGYLRVAPHFFVTDDEILRFTRALRRAAVWASGAPIDRDLRLWCLACRW